MLSRSSRVVVIAEIELAVDRVDRGGAYHSRTVMIYDHVRSRGATRVRPKSGNKRVQKHRRRSRDACMQANPRQGTGSRQGSGLEMNRRGIRNLGLATPPARKTTDLSGQTGPESEPNKGRLAQYQRAILLCLVNVVCDACEWCRWCCVMCGSAVDWLFLLCNWRTYLLEYYRMRLRTGRWGRQTPNWSMWIYWSLREAKSQLVRITEWGKISASLSKH